VSWPTVKLGDVAEFVRGITFKPADIVELDENSIGCMRTKNVQNDLNLQDVWGIDKGFVKNRKQYLKEGDILVSTANSWNLVGKGCWVPCLDYPCTFGGFISVLRGNEKDVFPRYLYYWYTSDRIQSTVRSFGQKTTNISNLNLERCLSLEFLLPPLPEQKRIAAILDKADSLSRKNQQAIQLADKFLRAVFLDMFGDPVTNPKGWDVKELKQGIISIKSGWSANGESIPCNSEQLGVLKISAVTSGVFKASENKYVPSETIPKNKALIFPKKGDLLFSRANTRELVAATCIVPENNNNVFLPDKLWKVETNKEKLLPEFLHYSIQQPRFRELLTSQATGTSGSMLNISKAKFEETDIIFPDIVSQKKFAKVYWKIQSIFSKLNRSSVCSFDSFNSLSQKAFAGEL